MTLLTKDLKARQYRWRVADVHNAFGQAKRELRHNVKTLTVRESLCTPEVVRALGYVGVTVTASVREDYAQCIGFDPRKGAVREIAKVRVCTLW